MKQYEAIRKIQGYARQQSIIQHKERHNQHICDINTSIIQVVYHNYHVIHR